MASNEYSSSATSSAALNFLDLPVEMKLRILSNLPAKDIQSSRRTCRHFRDLIDSPRNKTLLFNPGQSYARERLSQSVSNVFDVNGVSLLDAVARFVSHRGCLPDWNCISKIVEQIGLHWDAQHFDYNKDTDDEGSGPITGIYYLAEYLLKVHVGVHHRFDGERPRWLHREFEDIDFFLEVCVGNCKAFLELYGIDQDTIRKWHRAVISGHPLLLSAPTAVRPRGLLLTDLEQYIYGHESGHWRHRIVHTGGLASNHRIAQLLNVAEIPDSPVSFSAYCVKTIWAHRTIARALVDGRMSPAEETAILQEMYLYWTGGAQLEFHESCD